MAKLFLFAIGGTGSRVTKALTMLLAAGVRPKNTDQIIPIIVDPHASNDDLIRTKDLLKEYETIRSSLKNKPNAGFFSTEIQTLRRAVGENATLDDSYVFELQGVQEEQFKNYIDFSGLDPANRALTSLLFSDDNLETKMDIGFVGNPNIGSTVLNQFKNSPVFQAFAENFGADDRIFIISSIFGGTGAAGFPILLKNIRGAEAGKIPNPAYLKNARIGAVSVLPYFSITANDQKRVDPATFVSKTKAALNYYARNVNRSVNALYYVGDELNKAYAYDPGEGGQRNDAHFVELAAALAIVDFMNTSDDDLETQNGLPLKPVCKEFGIEHDETDLHLPALASDTQREIALPLAKMALLSAYLGQRLGAAAGNVAWAKQAPEVSSRFLDSAFMRSLRRFDGAFRLWLTEMGRNRRGFTPFLFDTTNLGKVIRGFEPKKRNLFGKEAEVDLDFKDVFDDTLNKVVSGKTYVSEADKFIQLFSEGTERLVRERFPNVP